MSRPLRKSTHGMDGWRLAEWVRRTVARWAGAGVPTADLYLHPCGDLLLFRGGSEIPLSDRLLVGVYSTDGVVGADLIGDIETALVELEWGAAA